MQPNQSAVIAGLRLLEAHANGEYSEAHNFVGLDNLPNVEEVRKLLAHFEKIQELVEQGFRARAVMQGYRGTRRIEAQADFLAGAMSVLNEVPPKWYFACIRGELV